MVLKRKRSSSELFSSPSRPDTMETSMSPSPRASFTRPFAPSHLPSRTMKRFRDNRPSDDEVHRKFYEWRAHHHESKGLSSVPAERTLNMLFSAQQQATSSHESMRIPITMPEPQQALPRETQRSLHSFWNIHSAPSSASSTPSIDQPTCTPSNCEDCGAGIGSSYGADTMDVDGYGFESAQACGPCGKHVCSQCSVTNLGEQRRCLQCAGRKVWVGGLGWTSVPVPFC